MITTLDTHIDLDGVESYRAYCLDCEWTEWVDDYELAVALVGEHTFRNHS